MKFLTPQMHGALDYLAAIALIVLPFLLDLRADSAVAHWLSVAGGAGLIVYSLLTDYPYSAASVIPFKVHLGLDLGAAAVFLIAPFVLGFGTVATYYYIVMAVGVLLVVLVTKKDG